jgi:translocation and assembly module TamB
MEATAEVPLETAPKRRRLWCPLRVMLFALAGLLLAMMVAVWAIDTGPGHRFIVDRIAALAPSSGLRIRIGRIDGSIWGEATLRDVRLYDAKGLFLEAPELDLDWRPADWLRNRLNIHSLTSDLVVLHRLPKLKPSARKRQAILPGFDIRIGKLDIRHLRVEPAVTGARRVARITGKADIRDGRALIDLKALTTAGDRLVLLIDSEPDRDKFDIETRVEAPSGGVLGAILGTRRPMNLVVTGDGRWTDWRGAARMDVSANRVIDLTLAAREGTYSLSGNLAPAPILKGKLQRLSSPRILVTGQAKLADRQLDTTLSLRSRAVALDAAGVLDLAESSFDGMQVNLHLLRPPALFPNMTGTNVRLRVTLDGPFEVAEFDYLLTAPRIAFDNTGFETVRIQGRGRLSKSPVKLPVRFTARRVTGVGDVAGGILSGLSVDGLLNVTARDVTGNGLVLRSDKLRGKLSLYLDLRTGRYDVGVSGQLTRYLIPGLGIVDVTTDVKVIPGPGGRGTRVEGRGRAWVRRFDNSFLRNLAGGLPQIDTRLIRGPNGVLMFEGLVLKGPAIRITGSGLRRRDGTFYFKGAGTQGSYGPFRMVLDGNIARPKMDLVFARPQPALGLADVSLHLDPNPQGFAYRADGGSRLGPFTSEGAILLPSGQPAVIAISALNVSGTRATGALRSDPGGFTGQLVLAGGGLGGQFIFSPVAGIQRIEAHLTADRAQIAAARPFTVRRGTLDGAVLLDPAGTSIEGTVTARGLRSGQLFIGRLAANGSMRGGTGVVRGSVAGSRGRSFNIQASAQIAPERVAIMGEGVIDGRPLKLANSAVLTAEGDGWRLAETRLDFAGGGATLAGHFGGTAPTEVRASLDRMPLTVLDIVNPELGLGGHASGKLIYSPAKGGHLPTGRADLRVRGLTRSGLVLSSAPVDLGLAVVLTENGAVARAVVASGKQTIGRAQARIAPLPAGGDLPDRLSAAPVLAQLRYNGPADTLWRLTGIETIDLTGPVAVGADISGRLDDPVIRGSMRTDRGRLESATTGTVIQNIKAAGRFGGSKLVIDSFAGTTPGGGALSGRAEFDLAAGKGLGMNIAMDAKQARLLDRDDIGATVTGPLSIRSDGSGGVIAGDVRLDTGRFRLGQAAAAAIPRLSVTELNRPAEEEEEARPRVPWRLDLHANARNRLMVTGLGLDSEWRADLDIKGTVENPAVTGRADLVRGGYEFAGRRFDLERGTIRFLGEAPPDPVLDIVAKANIQGLNATITVSGTGQRPMINFASIPAMPEDELLSRLLFGTSITNLSAPEALQLAAAVASLQGEGTGLNPINALRRAAGLDRLRILPADVTTGQGTSVAAGKYIGRRTYVEVITDGQGYSATRVEFQITRWLSILSTVSTIGRQSVNLRVSKDY